MTVDLCDTAASREWRVLVVDDDPDIHAVTNLVLKSRTFRNQRFELTSVYSQAEAVELLETTRDFHVALVDVVMEREDSGLQLCATIREICPRSTRIILRTGQAGLIPEEQILNEYDIDHYLHKLDMTPGRLFSVVRSCLRGSQDISTLLAYGKQLRSFTRTLQYVTAVDDLVVFMGEALRFLELKHNCKTTFNYDLNNGQSEMGYIRGGGEGESAHGNAMKLAHLRNVSMMHEHAGSEFGLSDNDFVMVFEAHEDEHGERGDHSNSVQGGIVFTMNQNSISEMARRDLAADARLFIENWCIAFSTLRLRERLGHEQTLRNQMYQDRLESIARMVTGVAHELNTPLGVARTAASVATEFADQLVELACTSSTTNSHAESLHESIRLMNKNLDRAHRLIQSFRKLSSSQLSDERAKVDVKLVVEDCFETMLPELKKSGIVAHVHKPIDFESFWNGYPGHLSQVIVNLTQNAIRYAYPGGIGGKIDVFIDHVPLGDGMRLRFVDYGRGVADDIKPLMFDAFVTTGRDSGGTGLGLAIVRNIVTNLLDGTITCVSEVGSGTTFAIDLPWDCQSDGGDRSDRQIAPRNVFDGTGLIGLKVAELD